MVDSLGYDKNYWMPFRAKHPVISNKYANDQSPLKSSFLEKCATIGKVQQKVRYT